jgi:hypothetical protein
VAVTDLAELLAEHGHPLESLPLIDCREALNFVEMGGAVLDAKGVAWERITQGVWRVPAVSLFGLYPELPARLVYQPSWPVGCSPECAVEWIDMEESRVAREWAEFGLPVSGAVTKQEVAALRLRRSTKGRQLIHKGRKATARRKAKR